MAGISEILCSCYYPPSICSGMMIKYVIVCNFRLSQYLSMFEYEGLRLQGEDDDNIEQRCQAKARYDRDDIMILGGRNEGKLIVSSSLKTYSPYAVSIFGPPALMNDESMCGMVVE